MRNTRWLVAIAVGTAATLCVPGVAYADKTVKASTASSAVCPGGQIVTGGKFTVTGALTSTTPITINTEVGATDRQPTSTTGSGSSITNTYSWGFDGLLSVGNIATTHVADNWSTSSNKFELSSVVCKTPVAATVDAQASLPGVTPSIHVEVNNPNPIMATYQVTEPSLGTQTVKVLGGGKGAVDFTPPASACGTAYQVTVKDNFGTQATASATLPACAPPVQPPVTPTPSKPAAKPSVSASASPSVTANPVASNLIDGDFQPLPTQGGVVPNVTSAAPHQTEKGLLHYPAAWIGAILIAVILAGVLVAAVRHAIHQRREEEDGD